MSGYRIFAFNGDNGNGEIDGEYRITIGNFAGQNLSYLASGDPNISPGSAQCSATPNNTGTHPKQFIETGDAMYPTGGLSSYAYQLVDAASNGCNTAFGGNSVTYYAREWITKYVTQLYTTSALTTEATMYATTKRFRRVNVNQEGTKDAAYLATFNASGLRTSPSKGCLFNTL